MKEFSRFRDQIEQWNSQLHIEEYDEPVVNIDIRWRHIGARVLYGLWSDLKVAIIKDPHREERPLAGVAVSIVRIMYVDIDEKCNNQKQPKQPGYYSHQNEAFFCPSLFLDQFLLK